METVYKQLKITSEFVGEKLAFWDEANDSWTRHYVIYVENKFTGYFLRFDYWTSKVRPKIELETELLEAFECFVADAVSGINSFSEFCSLFGYSNDSIKSHRSWIMCKQSYVDLLKLLAPEVTDDNQIYSYGNELRSYIETQLKLVDDEKVTEKNIQLFTEVFKKVKRKRDKEV
jgi:hypothetical protein